MGHTCRVDLCCYLSIGRLSTVEEPLLEVLASHRALLTATTCHVNMRVSGAQGRPQYGKEHSRELGISPGSMDSRLRWGRSITEASYLPSHGLFMSSRTRTPSLKLHQLSFRRDE